MTPSHSNVYDAYGFSVPATGTFRAARKGFLDRLSLRHPGASCCVVLQVSFDLATAMLVTSLLTLGVGASLLFAASRYPAPLRRALRIWIGGLTLQAFALLAVALLGPVPSVAVLVVSDVFYALAYVEMGRALRLFTGRPDRRLWPLLLVAAVALSSLLFSLVWSLPHWRVAIECVLIATLQLAVAQLILLRRHTLRPADWLTGALFLACGALALARSVAAFGGPLFGLAELNITARNIFLVFSSVLPTLGTIGFVLMCGDRLNDDLRRLAMVDPLTGVYNRRTLVGLAETAIATATHERTPLALLAIDIDHFKRVNDHLGHDAGDEALCGLVARLRESLRADQMLSRIGGEEFAILLPGCDETAAFIVGERLRKHVAQSPLSVHGRLLRLRISIGVAALSADAPDLRALLRNADHALYAAKRTGRNRVVARSALPRALDTFD
jgi:diguanylate cyclase (GGDEF)-like protein